MKQLVLLLLLLITACKNEVSDREIVETKYESKASVDAIVDAIDLDVYDYDGLEPLINKIERVTMRQNGTSNYTQFRLKGNGIVAIGPKSSEIANGRIIGAEVSITVLSDRGLTIAKKTGLPRDELVKKHGYHYTKTITTPRP